VVEAVGVAEAAQGESRISPAAINTAGPSRGLVM